MACNSVSLKKRESTIYKVSCSKNPSCCSIILLKHTFKLVYSLIEFLFPHLHHLTLHLILAFYNFLGLGVSNCCIIS